MGRLLTAWVIVFIALANVALSLLEKSENKTVNLKSHPQTMQARRQRFKTKKPKSTSSSESRQLSSSKQSAESMDLTESDGASDLFKIKKGDSFTDAEKTGWKKYHRECHVCTEDMMKKWRDPTIQWICGAYQRARRSFKSACMMYYRNCQDGTMFVEIHKGRCNDDLPGEPRPHGDHFFYEYKVVLTDESDSSFSSQDPDSGSYWRHICTLMFMIDVRKHRFQ